MSSIIDIQNLLSTLLLANVDRPSEDICTKIASLQGLAEMGGSSVRAPNSDWRRGSGTYQVQQKWRKGGGQQHQQQQQQQQEQYTPLRHHTTPELGTLPSTAGRYQSKFKNSSQPVEEKILNNIILSKLNKFSEATYTDVRDFLYQILGGGEADLQEFVRDFMRLVFKKAASEEIFCPLYAKLLSEISVKYTVILEEMNLLSDNYLEVFDEVTEETVADYATFVQKNSEKKYRLGYSQFLSELVKQEILPLPILLSTFKKLLTLIRTTGCLPDKRVLIEEYTDCLFKMTVVFKGRTSSFSKKARETICPTFMEFYQHFQDAKDTYVSCSPKCRFILMDIHDILKPHN